MIFDHAAPYAFVSILETLRGRRIAFEPFTSVRSIRSSTRKSNLQFFFWCIGYYRLGMYSCMHFRLGTYDPFARRFMSIRLRPAVVAAVAVVALASPIRALADDGLSPSAARSSSRRRPHSARPTVRPSGRCTLPTRSSMPTTVRRTQLIQAPRQQLGSTPPARRRCRRQRSPILGWHQSGPRRAGNASTSAVSAISPSIPAAPEPSPTTAPATVVDSP